MARSIRGLVFVLMWFSTSSAKDTAAAAAAAAAAVSSTTVKPYHFESAPKLHPMKEQHVIDTGQTFSLQCSGRMPVEWVLPEDNGGTRQGLEDRATIDVEEIPGRNPRPHVAKLSIAALRYSDTGRYVCRFVGTEDHEEHPENATATYLYARDPDYLFDSQTRYMFVNVPQYQEIVIPCKPTDPEIKMSFFKEGMNITDSLESRLFRYDPQRGLIVVRGTADFHYGMHRCEAERDGKSDTFTAILQFKEIHDVVQPPTIVRPQVDNVYVGANISITCQLPIDHSMPHHELEWEFPHSPRDLRRDKADGRIQVHHQVRKRIEGSSSRSNILVSKTVKISPVTREDRGYYACRAVIQPGEHESTPTKYHLDRILDYPDQAYLGEPRFNGEETVTIMKPGLSKWVFLLEANPDPGFTWHHPNGMPIDFGQLEKYEMIVDEMEDEIKLLIHDAELEDTGQYMFIVEVGDTAGEVELSKKIELSLKYLYQPELNLTVEERPIHGLLSKDEEYTLECDILGHPIDNKTLSWTFHRCSGYGICDESTEENWTLQAELIPTDGNVLGDLHYRYVSKLQVRATQSGTFTCRICSKEDKLFDFKSTCRYSSTEFFVTDYNSAFEIIAPTQDIVEGDVVELTCAASVYDFVKMDWLWREVKNDSLTKIDSHDIQVVNATTEFSLVSKLKFSKITLQHGGDYVCQAVPINGSMVEISESLPVLSIINPRRTEGNNMNGSEIIVNTSAKLTLNCAVQGRPRPQIVWEKDDFPINVNNATTLEFSDGGQSLNIRFAVTKDSGTYSCRAYNRGGEVESILKVYVTADSNLPKGLVAGIVVSIILLLILCGVLCWKVKIYNRKYKELTKAELDLFVAGDPQSINPELGVGDQADLLPYNREYEFPFEKLKLDKQLGAGAFGRVVKAEAIGIVSWEKSTTVAVKMVKPHADITYIRALMAELKIMIHLGKHLNIVNLLGACTTGLGKRDLLIIVEYCRFGNLQKYLLLHRRNFINQTDPDTGEINFLIGEDIIQQHGNDLAKAREEDEMSAAYANRNLSLSSTDGNNLNSRPNVHKQYERHCAAGDVGLPLLSEEGEADVERGGGAADVAAARPRKQLNVRYIADPANHRAAAASSRNRQESVMSDYNDGLDQIVLTDMTTVENDSNVRSRDHRTRRSESTMSHPGSGWRYNVRGEYEEETIQPISTKDLICWGYQVARGMEYLASKKVMHGDLACRNILLAADNVIKICDFGLAKDIYKTSNYRKKTDGPLPIKWMAIESIRDRVFSTQSDVWSFGIVLWEMFSLGRTPYPGIEGNDLFQKLLDGYHMEKPEYSPRSIYRIMENCWNTDPELRPDFSNLTKYLGEMLEEGDKDHYLDMSKGFAQVIGANNVVENKDYLSIMSAPDFRHQMSVPSDSDGYLMPTKQQPVHQQQMTDESGYLMPSSTANKPNGSATAVTTVPSDI